jgi:hypothetical protein
VFDVAGRQVATLLDQVPFDPGVHAVEFDGRMLPSGVYLCRLQAGAAHEIRRMVLTR